MNDRATKTEGNMDSSAMAGSGLRWRVLGLCAAVAFLDGFDTQALGPAAETIATELAIPIGRLGLAFSAVQVGFLLGAAIFSPLGDRLGRKPVLACATVLFAASSLGTMQAQSLDALIAFRFVAGLGLGGAGPNFISLASEHVPPQQRARTVTMLWAAVPLGGMVASYAGGLLIPLMGWRSLFLIGGVTPLALTLLLIIALPASPSAAPRQGERSGSAIAALFTAERLGATLWLWLASFTLWTGLIVVAFWTPALLQRAGWPVSSAASVLALNNAGGVVGTLVIGWIMVRLGAMRVLLGTLLTGGILVALMGLALDHGAATALAALGAGFCTSAAGGAVLAVSAGLYPPQARTTGVGWALGVGRTGAIIGPLATGWLIAAGWPSAILYLGFGLLFLASGFCVLVLSLHRSGSPSETIAAPLLGDAS